MKKALKVLILLSLPAIALAQITPRVPADFWDVFNKIVSALITGVAIVAVIFMILGTIQYVTSGGDPGKVESAKNILLYATIGLGLALLSYPFVKWLVGKLGG